MGLGSFGLFYFLLFDFRLLLAVIIVRVVLTSCEGSRCWYPRPGGSIVNIWPLIFPSITLHYQVGSFCLFPFPFGNLVDCSLRLGFWGVAVSFGLSVMCLYSCGFFILTVQGGGILTCWVVFARGHLLATLRVVGRGLVQTAVTPSTPSCPVG